MCRGIVATSGLPKSESCSRRDYQLDAYRALAIMYVVMVVHVGYWLDCIAEPLKSLILFEMPVIFFISGASMAVGVRRKNLAATIKSRCRRVIIPYYLYIAAGVVILAVYSLLTDSNDLITRGGLINAVLLKDDNYETLGMPYFYHTWFILPYLAICLLFWFEQPLLDRLRNRYAAFMFAVALYVISCLSDSPFVRQLGAYNLFFVAGYIYYRRITLGEHVIIAVLCILMLLGLILSGYVLVPMQSRKFPAPDIVFVCYGLIALCILSVVFRFVKLPVNRFLDSWHRHGFTIYLWQNWAYAIVGMLPIERFQLDTLPLPVRFLMASVSISLISWGIGMSVSACIKRLRGRLASVIAIGQASGRS